MTRAMHTDGQRNRRILVVDDNVELHHYVRTILAKSGPSPELASMEALLFGEAPGQEASALPSFEVTSAYQGEEALAAVTQARQANAPFATAFVDMRMPPGWDGLETIERIWAVDPDVQTVIFTAYSDYSWEAIARRFERTDRLLVLKKPFEPIEMLQMASALTEKWNQQAALRSSEEQVWALLAGMPDGMLMVSPESGIRDMRRSLATRGRLAAPGADPGEGERGDLPPRLAAQLLDAAASGIRSRELQVFEFEEAAADGARQLEARVVPLKDGDALAILRDITEVRRGELETMLRKASEERLRAQQMILSALSAPLIPIWAGVVLLPLIGTIDAARMRQVREVLVEGVARARARVAILDLTGVTSLDEDTASELMPVLEAVRLVGGDVVLTGIQGPVALTLTQTSIDLSGVVTRVNLQAGVAYAMQGERRERAMGGTRRLSAR